MALQLGSVPLTGKVLVSLTNHIAAFFMCVFSCLPVWVFFPVIFISEILSYSYFHYPLSLYNTGINSFENSKFTMNRCFCHIRLLLYFDSFSDISLYGFLK